MEDDIRATLENPSESYEVEFESGQIQTKFQGTFLDNFEAVLGNLYKLLDAEVKNEEDSLQVNLSPLDEENILDNRVRSKKQATFCKDTVKDNIKNTVLNGITPLELERNENNIMNEKQAKSYEGGT